MDYKRSTYLLPEFVKHINKNDVKCVIEVGSREGNDAIQLSHFYNAPIHAFECNPLTIDNFETNILNSHRDIHINKFALGSTEEIQPFYSYIIDNNPGASSLFQRYDATKSQQLTGYVQIRRLDNYALEKKISEISLICLDVQGYELNVLKGAGELLDTVKYVIMEVPKPKIIPGFLPEGRYSSYNNAPSFQEIYTYMTERGFSIKQISPENFIEDNILWVR